MSRSVIQGHQARVPASQARGHISKSSRLLWLSLMATAIMAIGAMVLHHGLEGHGRWRLVHSQSGWTIQKTWTPDATEVDNDALDAAIDRLVTD